MAPGFNKKQFAVGVGLNVFASGLARSPDGDAGGIVLANFEAAKARRLARDLAAILFGETYEFPQERKEMALAPAVLDRYTGKYEAEKMSFTVTREGDRLFVQATGQGKLQVYPYAENKFFLKVVDATVEFNPAGAKASEMVLNQAGRMAARRVE